MGCFSGSDPHQTGPGTPDTTGKVDTIPKGVKGIFRGSVQKGPVLPGSEVMLTTQSEELAVETTLTLATFDELGSFKLNLEKTRRAEIQAIRKFFNELNLDEYDREGHIAQSWSERRLNWPGISPPRVGTPRSPNLDPPSTSLRSN